MFQSQTRSRSTCDICKSRGPSWGYSVSISDEKPLHMRLCAIIRHMRIFVGFNLRREAAPHATSTSTVFQSQTRSRSTCDQQSRTLCGSRKGVSISDEKPLHMRLVHTRRLPELLIVFQSQTRSRSTCDLVILDYRWSLVYVSISDEKPLHMRLHPTSPLCRRGSVSISDEKPLHMRLQHE